MNIDLHASRRIFGNARAPDGSLMRDNFNQWFDGSQVIALDGSPLRVFHGSTDSFNAFNRNPKLPTVSSWFTADPSFAKTYTQGRGPDRAGGNIVPAYLSIKNPFRLVEHQTTEEWTAANVDRDKLIRNGYDGIVWTDTASGETIWIAFYPTQVKSSIGNNGMFSRDCPFFTDSETIGPTEAWESDFAGYLQAAAENAHAGWHFEEGGCWGMALALHDAMGGEIVVRHDSFVHAYVQKDGVLYDWQGACRPAPCGAPISRLRLVKEAQSNGATLEQVDSDKNWAALIIKEAKELRNAEVYQDQFYAESC